MQTQDDSARADRVTAWRGAGWRASRREFLTAGGLAAVASLVACDDDDDTTGPDGPSAGVTLNFGGAFGTAADLAILNYAYALEQLEAAFYIEVVNRGFASAITDAREQRLFRDLRDHEVIHREWFRAAITASGGQPIGELTPNFDAVNFADRTSVLGTAIAFEDLGVAAYNGAGPLFSNTETGRTQLALAGKIVSVEARHAAAVRSLRVANRRTREFVVNTRDPALTPAQVLAQAQPYIRNPITLQGVPAL